MDEILDLRTLTCKLYCTRPGTYSSSSATVPGTDWYGSTTVACVALPGTVALLVHSICTGMVPRYWLTLPDY